ncbi:hemolysin secretion protein D [Arcobacter cryaerophilus gv. occultus]|uniref:Hemolysin secretion protein D n=1 Tax=Aliarcobacter cryaerophilus TaxID=28198 RepID=A0A2S9T4N0_9BACT|nr:HlyD family type I secretion periplasmic adaptor subunit [Aliarcobacter cryaerophilus]PRM92431.1 hemolysin secretion protein D [Arcobacter cryaerophilus gv. occultus]PRM93797.1 hemolysin secretion protein D [Aliarcobacter cryaerophilus]
MSNQNNKISEMDKLTKSFRFQNRELLDNYVILAITDKNGIINHVSTNLCKIFLYKSSELLDKPYSFLISKDSIKTFEIQFNDAKDNKSIWKGEIKHSSSTDNIIWTDTIITPLFDDENELVGFILASNDITQEKRLKKINEENLLKKKYDNSILEFMPSISAAVLLKNASSLHKILWIICFTVIISLLWAYFSKVDDIVKTTGKIITTTNIQTISTIYSGRLEEIFVKEGSYVNEGDTLLKISTEDVKSDYEKKQLEKLSTLAKIVRVNAEANMQNLVPDEYILEKNRELMNNEIVLFESNLSKLNTSINILNEQIKQKENELKENEAKLIILRNSHLLLTKEIDIKKVLVHDKIISEVDFLQLKRRYNDTDLELKNTQSMIPILNSSIAELYENIEDAKEKYKNDAKNQIVESYSKLQTIEEEINLLNDKIENSTIKSPRNGTVNIITVKTKGEAISPGKILLEIIPETDYVIAEAKVSPSKIGFLYVGIPVRLKLHAYDFSLYGGLDGEVSYISADTIFDENTKEENYTIHIKSNQKYVGDNKNLAIRPGMTLDADIITGKKTILDYILRPVLKTLQIEG